MAEIISKERVPYRIWDKVNSVWNELKFKTNAKSVDANDGVNLESKVGAINGITSDLTCEDESIAASAVAVKTLNDSLQKFMKAMGYDENSLILVSQTQGINSRYTFNGYSDRGASINALENGIEINIKSGGNNAFLGSFSPSIDFSNYSKLKITYSCASSNNYIFVGLSANKHTNYFDLPNLETMFAKYSQANNGVTELDISELNGTYYLEFVSNVEAKTVEADTITGIELTFY